jgi:ACS family hexuronate transporter-like MFS transporter
VRTEVAELVREDRSRYLRWGVCGLLFFATTINYIDRQVLSILKPTLQAEFGWRESDYAWIVVAFQLAYAIAMPFAGRLIDRIGTRLGYAIAVVVWSAASISHAFARSAFQFMVARFTLGAGEAANFPAAVRTVANWFPQEERSFATGIFNSGSNIGVIAAAILVPAITVRMGWQAAFFITGGLGFLWVVPWLLGVRSQSDVSRSDDGNAIPYSVLLAEGASWAFIVGKFVTDPVWWFYLFWIPGFLNSTYHVDLTSMGPPLIAVYLAADVGSIGGGWLYKGLAARGWSPTAARKAAMLICAVSATPVMLLLWVRTLWPAVVLIGIAAAAHQGWSANLYTLVSDALPRRAVASVIGMGGLAGGVSGLLISPAVGYWLDFSNGSYRPIFVVAGTAYLLAFTIIHTFVPRLKGSH